MHEFIKSETGLHQIGGEKPKDLTYPENNFPGDFQYIGYLNRRDKMFDWLPFNLHLICPIFLNIEQVYLDYRIPDNPKIIYPQDTSSITTEYDELVKDSLIEFECVKTSLIKATSIDEMNCIGIAGNPSWIEEIDVPICPVNKTEMRFVCQLMTFGEIPVKKKNFESEYPDFDNMCFWGDGSLYIFMEPDSKTVCYFIQNT